MLTRYDRGYARLDSFGDGRGQAGRRLIQYEIRFRQEVLESVYEQMAEHLKPISDRMDELLNQIQVGTDLKTTGELAENLYQEYEECRVTEHEATLRAAKMALLIGEREGLRLGISWMLKLMTVQEAGGKVAVKAPADGDLLQVLRAMVDDDSADALILAAYGVTESPDE